MSAIVCEGDLRCRTMYLATVGWVISIPSFKQLAVNARRTPARVVAAHHPDQIADRLRYAGLTGLAAANSPRPEQAEAFTMPCNHCFWALVVEVPETQAWSRKRRASSSIMDFLGEKHPGRL